jgi:predicted ribosomally synthesized peptide with SipW-like signal peptide
MKTKMKALALALCAVLLVVSTVFVTMAFLTDRESVKNTFTFGKVGISLDEAKVNANGEIVAGGNRESTEGRVQENEYHLIPGHNYVKDPTIHVDDGSENCLLFVKLENGLKDIIASKTIEEQMEDYGWALIDSTNNIWAYNKVVAENEHIEVFDEFTLTDNAVVSNYGSAIITVTAYAVQADGFVANTAAGSDVSVTDAANAWTATADSFGN